MKYGIIFSSPITWNEFTELIRVMNHCSQKKSFVHLCLSLCLVFCGNVSLSPGGGKPGRPTQAPPAVDVKSKIESLLKIRHVQRASLGIKVVSLYDGSVIYSLNNEKNFSPASTMKIVTMALALEKLGADFRWKTEVWIDGPVEDGTLQGSLYVKGYGNPLFQEADIQTLAQMTKNAGIEHITGQVYYDDSYFDPIRNGPGVPPESTSYFDPIISALPYAFNFLSVSVSPGSKIGKPVQVTLSPASSHIRILNKAQTTKSYTRISISYNKTTGSLAVSGGQAFTGMPIYRSYKVFNPEIFFAYAFTDQLAKEGIKLSDPRPEPKVVGEGRAPAHILVVHYSSPLADVLRIMGKNSNNFIADQLFKTLGAETLGAPGSFEKGSQALSTYLLALGYRPGSFQIKDGSGLSHENQLSADILMSVLQRMYLSDRIRPTFVDSLAWAGMDGTLGERLTHNETVGRIFAKTGSLSGVSCLSGYVAAHKRGDLAFSIFINGAMGRTSAKRMEDAIVSVLADE